MSWLRERWLEAAATYVAALGLVSIYTALAGYAGS